VIFSTAVVAITLAKAFHNHKDLRHTKNTPPGYPSPRLYTAESGLLASKKMPWHICRAPRKLLITTTLIHLITLKYINYHYTLNFQPLSLRPTAIPRAEKIERHRKTLQQKRPGLKSPSWPCFSTPCLPSKLSCLPGDFPAYPANFLAYPAGFLYRALLSTGHHSPEPSFSPTLQTSCLPCKFSPQSITRHLSPCLPGDFPAYPAMFAPKLQCSAPCINKALAYPATLWL